VEDVVTTRGARAPAISCRSCGSAETRLVLSLGDVPLANALPSRDRLGEPDERFPLDLYFCPRCALVQIGENVPPEKLFSDYTYASSFSDTMLAHARAAVARLTEERRLGPDSLVVEIASNDGYLLQYYKERGVPVLGVEPARNIAAMAVEKGIPTLVEFFDEALGARLAADGRQADVVHANNVFAHVPDPNTFVAGLRRLLKPGGVAVIEAPYVGDLIEKIEFDTIYHEHYSYYGLSAVQALCRRHGLEVVDVERLPIHGGSLRYFIGHPAQPSRRVLDLAGEEERAGMLDFGYYAAFAERVWGLRDELMALLAKLKGEGARIAAYGASAKGSTLMNAFGVDRSQLDFVVDRSSIKQGRFTPGNRLEILPPSALMDRRPDYVLLLTWNFADEILEQQKAYRDAGGRFIIPLPTVQIV
jgi:SAM-dependent methyltransferase